MCTLHYMLYHTTLNYIIIYYNNVLYQTMSFQTMLYNGVLSFMITYHALLCHIQLHYTLLFLCIWFMISIPDHYKNKWYKSAYVVLNLFKQVKEPNIALKKTVVYKRLEAVSNGFSQASSLVVLKLSQAVRSVFRLIIYKGLLMIARNGLERFKVSRLFT